MDFIDQPTNEKFESRLAAMKVGVLIDLVYLYLRTEEKLSWQQLTKQKAGVDLFTIKYSAIISATSSTHRILLCIHNSWHHQWFR